jgi:APA family basic amino acid/polyamine antiporter
MSQNIPFSERKSMTLNSNEKLTLVRGLGLLAAVSIIVGNVIGTGVFLKARVMTCNVGSPTWVIVVWVAAGILSLAGALTYAELTAMKPQAGGAYVFLRDAYGRVWSFLFGWMQMFVARTGSQAAVAVAFAIFLNDFLGGALKQTLLKVNFLTAPFEINTIRTPELLLEFEKSSRIIFSYELTTLQIIAVIMIVTFTAINCASVALSGQIATLLTFVKIALVLLVGVGAFLLADGTFANYGMLNQGGACEGVEDAVKYGTAGFSFTAGFGAAMLAALWGYDGWDNLSFVAGEVKNPNRNIPLAIIGGTILIIFLYVFVNFAYFYVLDPTTIASVSKDSSVAREVVARFLGTGAVMLMTIGLMGSSLGTLHTSVLSGARVPYAMAQDGLMFPRLAKVSERTRVPVIALIVQGIWACLLALSGSFDTLTDYVVFGSWIFYALATASVFVFRIKYPDLERPYKAFGYPVVPVLFLFVAGWLIINTIWTSPKQSFMGIFLILLGLPVYYYLTRNNLQKTEE